MGQMLMYWLAHVTFTELLQRYPGFKHVRLWRWRASYSADFVMPIFAIFEQMLHCNALQELYLVDCYDEFHESDSEEHEWAPRCALKAPVYAQGLQVLHVQWSWLKMFSLSWFIHLKVLQLYLSPGKLLGANITSIAHCTALEQLRITWDDLYDQAEGDTSEETMDELQALRSVICGLQHLRCLDVTPWNSDTVYFLAFRITRCTALREFHLNCAEMDAKDVCRELHLMMSDHLPEHLRDALANDAEDPYPPYNADEVAHENWVSSFQHFASDCVWKLELFYLEDTFVDSLAVQLLTISASATLQKIQLKDVVFQDMEMHDFCELLSKFALHLKCIDIQINSTLDSWKADALTPLKQLSSLRTLRLCCPRQLLVKHLLCISEMTHLTDLEFNTTKIKTIPSQLLRLKQLQRLHISAHHLKLDGKLQEFQAKLHHGIDLQIHSCQFTNHSSDDSPCHKIIDCNHRV